MKSRQLNTVVLPLTLPADHEIVLIGHHVWSSGCDLASAVAKIEDINGGEPCDYEAHVCPISTDQSPVDDMGRYYHCAPQKHCQHCM